MPNNKPQLQSSLGEVSSSKTKNDRVWNLGNLAIGQVLRVHPKRYTADVRLYSSGDIFASSHDQEGRYSCRIGVDNAGYDTEFKKPYGKIVPIQKGSIVLVGFLGNKKEKPVILRVFHNISEDVEQNNLKNILDSVYSDDGKGEISRYLNITPIQDFVSVDRDGNVEIASHTKSFFVAKTREMDEEHFDFEDLTVKKSDNSTVSVDSRYSNPLKFMAVFRDKFLDSATNWLKIFIDASKTSFKLVKLQQAENKSTFLEITQNGDIKLRRQLDTKAFEGSKEYTEIGIDSKGKVTIKVAGDKETSLVVDGSGVKLKTASSVELSSDEDIKILGKNLKVTSNNIDFSGEMKLNNKRVAVEGDSTSDGATIK